jgi:hypothetical protein
MQRLRPDEGITQMRETFETIPTWADETFGPCGLERSLERAKEEWAELIEPGANIIEEAADVVICLLRLPGIAAAIDRKMAINRKRKWAVKGDGTGYHIKDPPVLGEPVEKGGYDIDRDGPPPFSS